MRFLDHFFSGISFFGNGPRSDSVELKPWGETEKAAWRAEQEIQRSYKTDILERLDNLNPEHFTIEEYGRLDYDPEKYPVKIVKVGTWDNTKPTILITGGVHGYETSGALGAIKFLEEDAVELSKDFNIVAAPCVSPWAYETINRWNPFTEDVNRQFHKDGKSQEAALLMAYIKSLGVEIDFHIDLHETTDTDATRFRPEKDLKEGKKPSPDEFIPDGFYLVESEDTQDDELGKAIIQSVRDSHIKIAPNHEIEKSFGPKFKTKSDGIMVYPSGNGLCMDFTNAGKRWGSFTTEIYPDGKGMNGELSILGQLAAIKGALNYLKIHKVPHFRPAP